MEVEIYISRLTVSLQLSPSALRRPIVKTCLKVDSREVGKQPRPRRRAPPWRGMTQASWELWLPVTIGDFTWTLWEER